MTAGEPAAGREGGDLPVLALVHGRAAERPESGSAPPAATRLTPGSPGSKVLRPGSGLAVQPELPPAGCWPAAQTGR
jgi:hypothetical protein